MTTSAQANSRLLNALATVIDRPLRLRGFVRHSASVCYTRTLNQADQRIVFFADYLPTYAPGVDAHIHPMVQVSMPRVSAEALRLVSGNELLLAGAPQIIINEPIDFTAPNEKRTRWLATGIDQFEASCESIGRFVVAWVLPFLSDVSTPEGLVRASETNDTRMIKQMHWYVFVAAAYILSGRLEAARQVVREHFDRPGPRRRFASLFVTLGIE